MRRLGPGEYDQAAAVFLDPSVKGRILGLDEGALQAMLQSEKAYVLMGDPGCGAIFHRLFGLAYQVHQAALPAARGKRAQVAGRNAIAWMFEHTKAQAIVGVTPADNRAAIGMAILCGFRRVGEIPGVFPGGVSAVITSINRATPTRGPEGGVA
jgi:hypothetical protein